MGTPVLSQRHAGVDALRLLSMLLICLLHCSVGMGVNPLLNSISCIAVNLFALITGYVCVQNTWKIKRYISLWFQVAFYSISFFVIGRALWQAGLADEYQPSVAHCFLPVPLAGGYWYFTAYTGLFMVMPFINKLVLTLNKRQYQGLVLAVCGITVFTVLRRTPEFYGRGYNMAWLMALYLVGGYFKLHPVHWRGWPCMAAYLLCSLAIWGLYHVQGIGFAVFDYATPLCLLSSCALFALFVQWPSTSPALGRVLASMAPCAFGVYLIQNHPFVWHWFGKGGKVLSQTDWFGCWIVVLSAVILFTALLFMDWCRAKLFRQLGVSRWAERLAAAFPAWLRDLEKM